MGTERILSRVRMGLQRAHRSTSSNPEPMSRETTRGMPPQVERRAPSRNLWRVPVEGFERQPPRTSSSRILSATVLAIAERLPRERCSDEPGALWDRKFVYSLDTLPS